MSEVKPFQLTVTGNAMIPHPAERALIHVTVASEGLNKAAVSDEAITSTKHVENILQEYSPQDDTPEAKAAAALAHWNKTSLSSTSWTPYNHQEQKQLPRQYKASVTFDIRFKEFKALGSFATKVSSLAHVEISKIDWILTAATEKSYRSQLRKEAAADALAKARDYCEVLGCSNIRPMELSQGSHHHSGSNTYAMMQQQMPRGRAFGPEDGTDVKNEDLEFRPQEVRMSHEVTIKFCADPASG